MVLKKYISTSLALSLVISNLHYSSISFADNISEKIEIEQINDNNESLKLNDSSLLSSAEYLAYGDYTYTVSNSKITITGYTGKDTNIIIPSEINGMEVVAIGNESFQWHSNLKSIEISEGVKSIGDHAFYQCSSLESVKIPEGITSIGNVAFGSCSSLKSITIPEGVKSIGYSTFSGCSNLESITIPEGVKSIGYSTFDNCDSLKSIKIPKGLNSIGERAFFNCDSLENIEILEGLTSIGNNAFAYCRNLQSAILPKEVTSIGYSTFFQCNRLTIYGYGGSYVESYAKQKNIKFEALDEKPVINASDVELKVGDKFEPLSGVSASDKEDEDIKSKIKVKENTVDTEKEGTYKVVYEVTDSGGNTVSKEIKVTVRSNEKPVITANDIEIEVGDKFNPKDGVSASDKEDEDITSKIKVKENTVDTEKKGTYNVVYEVTDSDGNTVTKEIKVTVRSSEKPLIKASDVELKVGDTFDPLSVVKASDEQDGEITSKIQVLKNTVNTSKKGTYEVVYEVTDSDGNTVTKEIKVTVKNHEYGYYEYTVSNSEITITRYIEKDSDAISAVIPSEINGMKVVAIGDYAFYRCNRLIYAIIPEGVTSIGDSAFSYCNNLESIYMKEGVMSIGDSAFYECRNLSIIQLREGLKSIGDSAFYECIALTDMIIPEGVTSIGNSAFSGCFRISNIQLNNGLKSIGEYAFNGCHSLTRIIIPKSVTNIGEFAFNNLTIYGYLGSHAEIYARNNSILFEALDAKPVINASDITLKVGDKFEPLKGVSASDKEDGEITKIEVKGDKVDTSKVGEYKVIYEVTDKDGNTVSKEIKVTVETSEGSDWKNHWARNEIKYAMEKGWINTTDKFRPNDSITRAEFIKIVNKSFGYNTPAKTENFTDVKKGDWWYNEVLIALNRGYITSENETFRPSDSITRQEVAAIITTIKKNKDSNLDKIKKLEDFDKISNWAQTSVEGAIEAGYMGKGGTKFRPKDSITRAEAVVTLYRVVKQ